MHLKVEQYSMCMKSFIIFKHLSSISFLTIIILSSSSPQTNACVAQHLLMRHFWQIVEVESYLKELLSSPDWPVVASAIQAGVERANSRAVSNVANIKKWTVLPRQTDYYFQMHKHLQNLPRPVGFEHDKLINYALMLRKEPDKKYVLLSGNFLSTEGSLVPVSS